jgi:hypothetical protein
MNMVLKPVYMLHWLACQNSHDGHSNFATHTLPSLWLISYRYTELPFCHKCHQSSYSSSDHRWQMIGADVGIDESPIWCCHFSTLTATVYSWTLLLYSVQTRGTELQLRLPPRIVTSISPKPPARVVPKYEVLYFESTPGKHVLPCMKDLGDGLRTGNCRGEIEFCLNKCKCVVRRWSRK